MSRSTMPIVTCDGDGGYCDAQEIDWWTMHASRVDGEPVTELPKGWTRNEAGDEFCPEHIAEGARIIREVGDILGTMTDYGKYGDTFVWMPLGGAQ